MGARDRALSLRTSGARPTYREKVYRFWEQVRDGRVADRAPLRLAGEPLGAATTTMQPAPARLITPGRTRAERHAAPGAIPILRGGSATPRDG